MKDTVKGVLSVMRQKCHSESVFSRRFQRKSTTLVGVVSSPVALIIRLGAQILFIPKRPFGVPSSFNRIFDVISEVSCVSLEEVEKYCALCELYIFWGKIHSITPLSFINVFGLKKAFRHAPFSVLQDFFPFGTETHDDVSSWGRSCFWVLNVSLWVVFGTKFDLNFLNTVL